MNYDIGDLGIIFLFYFIFVCVVFGLWRGHGPKKRVK